MKLRGVSCEHPPRYQFICLERGCGPCGVKLIDAVYLERSDLEGNVLQSESTPRLVSTCCGSHFEIWDNRKDDTASYSVKATEDPTVEAKTMAEALRKQYELTRPTRLPLVGEIVEVDGKIGICTEYRKGYCYVRQMQDGDPWLDFISDEERHGPCRKKWRIRDDL